MSRYLSITDYNDKQASVDNIPPSSNPPEKQSVTDVTNITDPNDAKPPGLSGQRVIAARILKIILIM
jgi:hypothetical protein